MHRSKIVIAFAILLLGTACSLEAGMVVINSSYTHSEAYDGNEYPGGIYYGWEDNDIFQGFESAVVAVSVGGASSSTTTSLSEFGGQSNFDFDLNHARAGGNQSYARSVGEIHFTPSENTSYVLSGNHDLTGKGAIYVYAFLHRSYDSGGATVVESVFDNFQYSENFSNESITLGEEGGNQINNLFGGLSGSLIGGDSYHWYFDVYIHSYADGVVDADAASAIGKFTLTIGEDATAVPEPGSMALLGLTAFSASAMRWRLRRRSQMKP